MGGGNNNMNPNEKALEEFILFMSDGFKKQTEEMKKGERENHEKRKSEEIEKILESNPYF